MNIVHEILAATDGAPMPKAGDGATVLMWSDRYPATILRVQTFKSGSRKGELNRVTVQRDIATIVSGSQQDGSARYEYERDETGPVDYFRMNNKGQLVSPSGYKLRIGSREKYYDPHF